MDTSIVLTDPLTPAQTQEPISSFMHKVMDATPGDSRLDCCIQCGTCGGSCPSGPDMDHTPRMLFAMIRAGLKDQVLRSNTPWFCVSCYYCTVRCPQEIQITDLMYTLKRMAIEEGLYEDAATSGAPDFSETFIDYVNNYGRSFELGLATRYHLRHHPLNMMRIASSTGVGLLLKGRMDLTPRRINNLDQLKRILAKARELGAQS